MNIVSLTAVPVLLGDIVVGPPPPPPDLVAGQFAGNALATIGFWVLALAATAGLWWLRRQRSQSAGEVVTEPK